MASPAVPALKAKSSSLPLLTKRKLRQQTQHSPEGERQQQIHLHVPDRLEEQLPIKVKLMAERSMKKLEEKYDTIDRWKQRYIPQSDTPPAVSSAQSHNSSRKLPALTSCLTPTIPDQAEFGKKLQAGLKERSSRNKRYYEHKRNVIEKEINYFEEGQVLPVEKRREIELKKLLMGERERKRNMGNGLMYQQIKLRQQPDRKEKWQVHVMVQQRRAEKREQEEQWKRWSPEIGSGLQELKRRWMQEAIESTPEGWNLKQEAPNQIEQTESGFTL